jgi:hypothetical protein
MTDPTYVDPDNPWEDEDNAWRYTDDLPHSEVVRKAMDVCGRTSHTFRTRAERRKWRLVMGKVERGLIPLGWVEHCIDFAREKNAGGGRIKYPFRVLTKYVSNDAARTDWQSKNKEKLWRPEDYGDFPS